MAITLNGNMAVVRPGIVAQTYGLLSMGLILASLCAVASIGATFTFWGMIGAFIGSIVLMFIAMAKKDNIVGLVCYFGFISLMGYMMGPTISHYLEMPHGSTIVMQALGTTAVTTIGLSLYALVSGRSFNQLAGFLFVGLIVVIVAGIANMFIGSKIFDVVIAGVTALVFCGYILFDTSRILRGEVDSPIEGAISMFLNVLNLFVSLLRIFGYLSNDDWN